MVQWYLDHPTELERTDLEVSGTDADHKLHVQHARDQRETWAQEYRSLTGREVARELAGDESAEAREAHARYALYHRAWRRLSSGPVVAPEPRVAEVDAQWRTARSIAVRELDARAASEAGRGQEQPATLDMTRDPGAALGLLSEIARAQADKASREPGATPESPERDTGIGM